MESLQWRYYRLLDENDESTLLGGDSTHQHLGKTTSDTNILGEQRINAIQSSSGPGEPKQQTSHEEKPKRPKYTKLLRIETLWKR